MSKLLIDEEPLQVLPNLAKAIGLNEALVLQQVHYWLNRSDKFYGGRKWTFNSYTDWQKQFPFWSESSIKRIFQSLEKLGLLITGNFNKMPIDRTKWYTIDYSRLDEFSRPSGQFDPTNRSDCTDEEVNLTPPIPETTTETTTENLFAQFWLAYPKKKSKGDAERAFKKLKANKEFLQIILSALEGAKKSKDWQKENGKYIPYPASWLNSKGWEDEFELDKPKEPGPTILW